MLASESLNGHRHHHHPRQHQDSNEYNESIFKKVDQVASDGYGEKKLAHDVALCKAIILFFISNRNLTSLYSLNSECRCQCHCEFFK